MHKTFVLLTLAASSYGVFGQGQLTLQNRLSGTLIAPIYGCDPSNP